MRIVVIGRAREVRGFSLAGVETAVCQAPADASARVSALGAPASGVGLLLLSAWAARAAERPLAAIRERQGPPVILELPGDGNGED
jgi:vacuolar-type H+-ATPase subunit F/Vma7